MCPSIKKDELFEPFSLFNNTCYGFSIICRRNARQSHVLAKYFCLATNGKCELSSRLTELLIVFSRSSSLLDADSGDVEPARDDECYATHVCESA